MKKTELIDLGTCQIRPPSKCLINRIQRKYYRWRNNKRLDKRIWEIAKREPTKEEWDNFTKRP